jgi:hypothetical protein
VPFILDVDNTSTGCKYYIKKAIELCSVKIDMVNLWESTAQRQACIYTDYCFDVVFFLAKNLIEALSMVVVSTALTWSLLGT